MVVNPYANLQFQNPGNAFLEAFDKGRTRRREADTQNALAKYATAQSRGGLVAGDNPLMKEALSELARLDPKLSIELQRNQRQEALKGAEGHRESIVAGAQLFREAKKRNPNVPDEQIYAQVLPLLQQMRIDTSGWPQPGDPQLSQHIQNALTVADAFEPEKQGSGPSSVQEYEYAKQQGFTGSYMAFMEEKRGPMIASNGDGTFTIVPRSMVQGGQQQANLGPPAPPNVTFTPIDGGPTPQASGGFPAGPR